MAQGYQVGEQEQSTRYYMALAKFPQHEGARPAVGKLRRLK